MSVSTKVSAHFARKIHRCSWCGQAIEIGMHYKRYRWFGDDGPSTVKMHPECLDYVDDLARNEWGPIEWIPGEGERPCKQEEQEISKGEPNKEE